MNLRMPAEWEHHAAVWLAWPHDEISWPNRITKVENDIVKIIHAVHKSERVELLVLNEPMMKKAETKLEEAGVDLSYVNLRMVEYMDAWLRDCAGIFVKAESGELNLVKWIFNVWGNKFPDLKIDANIPDKIAGWTNTEILEPGIVMEGGAIDVNGEGTLLTTEQCLLNPNRNPGLNKADYERFFSQYLGVNKTVWLKQGLVNDHTDGHIDDIARFVSPTKVLAAFEDDESDENYGSLKENYQILEKHFEVVKLPMPHIDFQNAPAGNAAGSKAPVSYANFYIANKVVLIPTFADPNDQKALDIIQTCFPTRKVVGIDSCDLIYGGGTIHCITQQQPSL